MTKIIKLYIDIGCSYRGDEETENIYKDIENWNIKDCGIIGMLKLELDIQKRIKSPHKAEMERENTPCTTIMPHVI